MYETATRLDFFRFVNAKEDNARGCGEPRFRTKLDADRDLHIAIAIVFVFVTAVVIWRLLYGAEKRSSS